MANVKVPVSFGVSSGAVARAKAAVDPNLYPPKDAKVTTDKNGKTYTRWTAGGTVDQVWSETTKGEGGKAKLGVFLVAVRFAPGEANQNKLGWFRMMIHPDIASGKPVSEAVKKSYEGMTERNLGSLVSLLEVAGKMPASGDLSPSLLGLLFPEKGGKSPLTGLRVTVKICQQPNEGGQRDVQEIAEVFLPAKAPAAPDTK
jgi:hypothetical protein